MARKGQKFNTITLEIRELVIKNCVKGYMSERHFEKKYGVNHNTVHNIIKKYREYKTIKSKTKKGRPKTAHLSELERLRLENEILKKFQAFLKGQQEKK